MLLIFPLTLLLLLQLLLLFLKLLNATISGDLSVFFDVDVTDPTIADVIASAVNSIIVTSAVLLHLHLSL